MNNDGEWGPYLPFIIQRTVETMRLKDLQIVGFRDRRGRLRYALTNNEIIHSQTVRAMEKRGLIEQVESTEEANRKNEVHYRLKREHSL